MTRMQVIRADNPLVCELELVGIDVTSRNTAPRTHPPEHPRRRPEGAVCSSRSFPRK